MRPLPAVERVLCQPQYLRRVLLCTTASPPPPKEIKVAVSSLRVDTVAAAGLDISRKHIWEAFIDGLVTLNGQVSKKSSHVQESDIIEVDTVLKEKQSHRPSSSSDSESEHTKKSTITMVKRGRVVVKEIGAQTRKGGYRLTLLRYKQFAVFQRTMT